MDVSALDLATVCAELVGTCGTSAVIMNRLLRCYSDAPNELRRLQAQAISAKQSLDQILSFLDSDPPAFQRQDDLGALNTYFSAIRTVANDAQRRVARLENGATGQPGSPWSSVGSMWDISEISAGEERLIKQVKALSVYINIATLDEKSQYLAKLRHARDLTSARDDAYTYVDGIATSFESPPPYELTLPTEAGVTIYGIGNASTQPNNHSQSHYNFAGPSRSSASPPPRDPMISPAQRPLSQPDILDGPSVSSLALVRSTPHDAENNALVPYLGLISQRNGVGPSESTLTLPTSPTRTDTGNTSDNGSGTWTLSGLSARKIKSKALLRKARESPLPDNGVQGDILYPEEFRARVSNYTTGVTPAWRPITVLGKGKGKLRYRNWFTKDPEDDIVKSSFKIGDKKLWDAIINKETEKVETIMQHKWSDNIIVEKQDGLTALHMAASLGLCSIVQVLVTTDANPNCTDQFSATPLHYAADFGCSNCIRILVDAGAKINGVPPKSNIKPPIWYAVERGNLEAVRTLLRLGAHFLNQLTTIKGTLLHVAVKTGSVPICQSLLEAGANPNESFSTLLMASSRSPDLLGCLRKAGADINMRDTNQETLLHKYVSFGDVPMVCYILALGGDPNLVDGSGRTPLHTALAYGDLKAAATLTRVLVKKGADINAQDTQWRTPLHLAVLWGRADAVHILCQAGAEHNIDDGTDTSPWAETQKPDYAARVSRNNSLADYKKSKHIMAQWHGKPVRKKPALTLTPELLADLPNSAPAAPAGRAAVGVQAQELDAAPRRSPVELPA